MPFMGWLPGKQVEQLINNYDHWIAFGMLSLIGGKMIIESFIGSETREIKNPRLQRRYWYFREISAIKGYGREMETKITLLPKAAFAGDVFNLGLGKLIAMRFANPFTGRREILLGILAAIILAL